jgi:hypothetical protein
MESLVASSVNAVLRWGTTVFVVALGMLLCCGAYLFFLAPNYYLPPQQRVVQQFESNRADYIRFVDLLRKDPSVRSVGGNGKVDVDGMHRRLVPEYRDLMGKIGAKYVIVRENGSMEFALWGDGCAIC